MKDEGKRKITAYPTCGAKTYAKLIRVPLVLYTEMAEIVCHHEFCVR